MSVLRVRRFVAALSAVLAISGVGALQAGLAAPATAAPATTTLFNSAQAKFTNGDVPGGLGDLGALLRVAPNDAQALALQAVWSDYTLDLITRQNALNRLGAVSPAMAGTVGRMFGAIGAGVGTIPNPLPGIIGPQTAIVVLGYGLLPDGSMRDELNARMQAAWLQAVAAPSSTIIVSGGAPHAGVTEAAAMRNWLISRGIPASRIVAEDRSGSTVQNAINSASVARSRGLGNAILVSSANHLRRAVADFTMAGLPVVGATTQFQGWLPELIPPLRPAQRGIYLDVTRTAGIPARR
ncbi:YdcF family protein [Williamsia sp. SKLECPSW1]